MWFPSNGFGVATQSDLVGGCQPQRQWAGRRTHSSNLGLEDTQAILRYFHNSTLNKVGRHLQRTWWPLLTHEKWCQSTFCCSLSGDEARETSARYTTMECTHESSAHPKLSSILLVAGTHNPLQMDWNRQKNVSILWQASGESAAQPEGGSHGRAAQGSECGNKSTRAARKQFLSSTPCPLWVQGRM